MITDLVISTDVLRNILLQSFFINSELKRQWLSLRKADLSPARIVSTNFHLAQDRLTFAEASARGDWGLKGSTRPGCVCPTIFVIDVCFQLSLLTKKFTTRALLFTMTTHRAKNYPNK